MPEVNEYKCNKCGFTLPRGWGGYMYVMDEDGKRLPCPHPAESSKIAAVLGLKEGKVGICYQSKGGFYASVSRLLSKQEAQKILKLFNKRIGFNSHCICLKCLVQFELDINKDKRKCPICGSKNIKTELELIGQPCPKCKKGIMEEVKTGIIS